MNLGSAELIRTGVPWTTSPIPGGDAMPPAPPAVDAITGDSEQAKTAPRPPAPDYDRRNGQAPLARAAAGRTQPAQPAAACSETTGGTTAEIPGIRPRRFGVLLRRIPKMRGTYVDPLFARPDLVEDDYYRLRRQLDS